MRIFYHNISFKSTVFLFEIVNFLLNIFILLNMFKHFKRLRIAKNKCSYFIITNTVENLFI